MIFGVHQEVNWFKYFDISENIDWLFESTLEIFYVFEPENARRKE